MTTPSSTHTVGSVCAWFLKFDARMRNPDARKERSRVLALFLSWRRSDGQLMADVPVADAIGADLHEFLAQNLRGKSQWTRRRWAQTIKTPFNAAANLGLTNSSPFNSVRERKGKRGRDLSWDEFRAMLRVACPPMRRILFASRWSGARPYELRGFTWDQMDWVLCQIVQEDHKTAHVVMEPRVIQTVGKLVRLLRWLKRQNQNKGTVFLNSHGRPWTRTALCKHIRALRERAGLADDAKMYGIRHLWCSEAVANNVNLAHVARLAGHKGLGTILNYVHDRQDALAASAERAIEERTPASPGADAEQIKAMIALLQAMLEKNGG